MSVNWDLGQVDDLDQAQQISKVSLNPTRAMMWFPCSSYSSMNHLPLWGSTSPNESRFQAIPVDAPNHDNLWRSDEMILHRLSYSKHVPYASFQIPPFLYSFCRHFLTRSFGLPERFGHEMGQDHVIAKLEEKTTFAVILLPHFPLHSILYSNFAEQLASMGGLILSPIWVHPHPRTTTTTTTLEINVSGPFPSMQDSLDAWIDRLSFLQSQQHPLAEGIPPLWLLGEGQVAYRLMNTLIQQNPNGLNISHNNQNQTQRRTRGSGLVVSGGPESRGSWHFQWNTSLWDIPAWMPLLSASRRQAELLNKIIDLIVSSS